MRATETGLNRKSVWILAAAAAVALGVYLISSRVLLRNGFPLDDAWIHQTYARNLAALGEWAYVPGEISAGSTAPLWSLLLTPGHALGLGPLAWAYVLGWLALWGGGCVGERLFRRITGKHFGVPWAGLFLVFEWHWVWAAGSGMETLAFGLVILAALFVLSGKMDSGWALGALIGVAVWLRPDGITLLGPAALVLALKPLTWKQKLRTGLQAGLPLLMIGGGYLLFNQTLAGSWWPNTFYAKQAEYASLLQLPLMTRLARMFLQPLVGAGVLLLPGAVVSVVQSVRMRQWAVLSMALWWAGYTLLYALRLPVIYQHGRYLIPGMAVYLLLGLSGTYRLLSSMNQDKRALRVVKKSVVLSVVMVHLAFFALGAKTYAEDVAIIETEMVETAHWLRENTEESALIAVHDIGAVGYFSERKLLDLAGLISPDVIPFIRDELELAGYLDLQGTDYLVTFPEWYPQLISGRELLHDTGGEFVVQFGQENMRVYRWK